MDAQAAVLTQVQESFAGLPIWRSAYRAAEPVGLATLTRLAQDLYAGTDPLEVAPGDGPFRLTRSGSRTTLRLALPFVSSDEVDLARNGDDLVVTVASYRRLLTLPSGLARHQIAGARVDHGELQVRFEERTS